MCVVATRLVLLGKAMRTGEQSLCACLEDCDCNMYDVASANELTSLCGVLVDLTLSISMR